MPFIEIQNLTKQYGEKVALGNVGLKVERGDFFAIVGPSGAGKTTLLRLLDLLEEPSSGSIFLDGIDTSCSEKERLALRRQIGMVFQRSVMLNASVYDNVAYPLRIRGMKEKIVARVNEALNLVGLTGFEKRRAVTLSGGEAQRVSLAQALVFEPKVLLLDEPTANLDPRNVSIIEAIVSKVNREDGVTVVMATHNIAQAENSASKAAILREGSLVEAGDAGDMFGKPSEFLASFSQPWNVYSGLAEPLEEGLALVDLGNDLRIEAATQKKGKVTILIRPEEIILSTSPIQSSARNMLKGRVTEILDLNQQVQLKVNAGKEFTVIITKKSFKDMRLNLESSIYLNFKASSVRVL